MNKNHQNSAKISKNEQNSANISKIVRTVHVAYPLHKCRGSVAEVSRNVAGDFSHTKHVKFAYKNVAGWSKIIGSKVAGSILLRFCQCRGGVAQVSRGVAERRGSVAEVSRKCRGASRGKTKPQKRKRTPSSELFAQYVPKGANMDPSRQGSLSTRWQCAV
jgi:hypothetical protein